MLYDYCIRLEYISCVWMNTRLILYYYFMSFFMHDCFQSGLIFIRDWILNVNWNRGRQLILYILNFFDGMGLGCFFKIREELRRIQRGFQVQPQPQFIKNQYQSKTVIIRTPSPQINSWIHYWKVIIKTKSKITKRNKVSPLNPINNFIVS